MCICRRMRRRLRRLRMFCKSPRFCVVKRFAGGVCRNRTRDEYQKGQFLSPREMLRVAEKAKSFGAHEVLLCERGASFGYNNLVRICGRWSSCANPVARSFLMRLIRRSCPVRRGLQRRRTRNDFAAGACGNRNRHKRIVCGNASRPGARDFRCRNANSFVANGIADFASAGD